MYSEPNLKVVLRVRHLIYSYFKFINHRCLTLDLNMIDLIIIYYYNIIIIKSSIMSKLMLDCEIIRCIFLSFLKFEYLSVISDMNLSVASFF